MSVVFSRCFQSQNCDYFLPIFGNFSTVLLQFWSKIFGAFSGCYSPLFLLVRGFATSFFGAFFRSIWSGIFAFSGGASCSADWLFKNLFFGAFSCPLFADDIFNFLVALPLLFRGFFRSIRRGNILSFLGLLAVVFVGFSGAFFLLFFLLFFRGFLPFQNRWKSSGLGKNGKRRKRAVKKRKSKHYEKYKLWITFLFFCFCPLKMKNYDAKSQILRSNSNLMRGFATQFFAPFFLFDTKKPLRLKRFLILWFTIKSGQILYCNILFFFYRNK